MPTFAFEARTTAGELSSGHLIAASKREAAKQLAEQKLFVVRLAEQAATRSRSAIRPGASRAEVAWFMAQLSVMIDTGLRLSDALECLARQAGTPKLRSLLDSVGRAVGDGHPLSDAMARHPRSFPSTLVAMVRASELSGSMASVLHRCSEYLLEELESIKRVRAALMYPAFMLGLCLIVTVFLLTVILPRFASIFASRGAALPLPTRVLMAISEFLIGNWYAWIPAIAVLGVGGWLWLRSRLGQEAVQWSLIHVPVFSGVFRTLCQGRIYRVLSVLLNAGVPLLDAVRIARDVAGQEHYRQLWRRVEEQMVHGGRLAQPLLDSPLVPEPMAQMIDSGDRAGRLGMVFARLAEFVEREHVRAVKSATQFIEPVMILAMGGLIGFIAASLLLPMFQAGQVMSN